MIEPGDEDESSEFAPDDEAPLQPSDTPTVNAADPRQVRKTKRTQAAAAAAAKEFWVALLNTPIGRAELWKLIAHAFPEGTHAFNQTWAASPVGFPDENAAWYQRGVQDFGLGLYHKWMALNPQGVLLMHAENDPRFVSHQTKPKRDTNGQSE